MMNFETYCKAIDGQEVTFGKNVVINFTNRNGEVFSLDPTVAVNFLIDLQKDYDEYVAEWGNGETRKTIDIYDEKSYRRIFKYAGRHENSDLKPIATLGGSQTAKLTSFLVRVMCYCAKLPVEVAVNVKGFDKEILDRAVDKLSDSSDNFLSDISFGIKRDNKVRFEKWLKKKKLSDKSIITYLTTVPNKFDRILLAFKIENKFFEVSSLNNFQKLYDLVLSSNDWIAANTSGNGMYDAAVIKYREFLKENFNFFSLSKPFLILAGISGTGKSRFVRKQAEASGDGKSNFKLVSVRPNWYEPADLLGYVSRIGGEAEYVATDVLRFIAAAWCEVFVSADSEGLVAKNDALVPYWLCLDEMNLAPVEQYFADYLSVLETQQRKDGFYRCEPLLTPAVISQLEETGRLKLRDSLKLSDVKWDSLWQAFCIFGIPLPPNLIVAGTVNVDESTFVFSRKVIDRAITLDFGEFFPNDFDSYFGSQPLPVTLGCPQLTSVTKEDFALVEADPDGNKTVAFLKAVNAVMVDTPFQLAYRALNELLLAVVLCKPTDDVSLQAVWDDFLMTKVLPRIEGDEERLALRSTEIVDKTVLDGLQEVIRIQLSAITDERGRPDLLRLAPDGQKHLFVAGRSLRKLGWMQRRLVANRFTSFWP